MSSNSTPTSWTRNLNHGDGKKGVTEEKRGKKKTKFFYQQGPQRLSSPNPTWQMFPQAGIFVPPHSVPGCMQADHFVRGCVAEGALSCCRRGDVGKGRAHGSGTGQCPQWTETQALGGLPKYLTPTVGL